MMKNKLALFSVMALVCVSCTTIDTNQSEKVDPYVNCDLYNNCPDGYVPKKLDTTDFDNENCDLYDTCNAERKENEIDP